MLKYELRKISEAPQPFPCDLHWYLHTTYIQNVNYTYVYIFAQFQWFLKLIFSFLCVGYSYIPEVFW